MKSVAHESSLNLWAVGINGARVSSQPTTREQAVTLAKTMVAKGYSVDVGYAQINTATLKKFGLSIEQGFEPCRNLGAMQTVLIRNYVIAAEQLGEGQPALQAALSAYNTGNIHAGVRNGYVRAVYRQASVKRAVQAAKPEGREMCNTTKSRKESPVKS